MRRPAARPTAARSSCRELTPAAAPAGDHALTPSRAPTVPATARSRDRDRPATVARARTAQAQRRPGSIRSAAGRSGVAEHRRAVDAVKAYADTHWTPADPAAHASDTNLTTAAEPKLAAEVLRNHQRRARGPGAVATFRGATTSTVRRNRRQTGQFTHRTSDACRQRVDVRRCHAPRARTGAWFHGQPWRRSTPAPAHA
jgi:hypothetical protein